MKLDCVLYAIGTLFTQGGSSDDPYRCAGFFPLEGLVSKLLSTLNPTGTGRGLVKLHSTVLGKLSHKLGIKKKRKQKYRMPIQECVIIEIKIQNEGFVLRTYAINYMCLKDNNCVLIYRECLSCSKLI